MGNSAKAYDKKTAAFAGFIIQNIPADLTDEVMDGWMNNSAATKRFLSGLAPRATDQDVYSVIATTRLRAVYGKLTKNCFTGLRYELRDQDFDNWLPANQPDAGRCVISTLEFSEVLTFRKVAASILGISVDTDIKFLGKSLIERGYIMTLPQAEEMIEATERDENTGMQVNGCGNFFFVEIGGENGPVSVGSAYRVGYDWRAYIYRLVDLTRCNAGHRFLLRNLKNTSKL